MRIRAPKFRSASSSATPRSCCAARRRERRVPAREFFPGALATLRQPDELVVAIDWPRAPADAGHAFEEIAQRHGDFAIAAAACELRLDGATAGSAALSLGLGGVENRPVVVDTADFIGRPADAATATPPRSMRLAPSTRWRTTARRADYRRALSQVLAERVVLRAAEAARQKSAGVR